MKRPFLQFFSTLSLIVCSGFHWGFYAHQRINQLAIFTLPPEMIVFYKQHADYLGEAAVNPDKRRFSVPEEAPRHYIDIDHYGDSAVYTMPRFWKDAVAAHGEDTLTAYGILPWHINVMYGRLKNAFLAKDPDRILRLSAEIGHYLADANVPLHTTENYNGQLTGQDGIHGFWESRLPELFAEDYNFFVGKAEYLPNIQLAAWQSVIQSHLALDSVLIEERKLAEEMGNRKYSFETKGKQTMRVYSREYAQAYHEALSGMVERQMRRAIRQVGCFWYSAWVDAGQPDLRVLINYKPTEEELARRREEVDAWKKSGKVIRDHEATDQ